MAWRPAVLSHGGECIILKLALLLLLLNSIGFYKEGGHCR